MSKITRRTAGARGARRGNGTVTGPAPRLASPGWTLLSAGGLVDEYHRCPDRAANDDCSWLPPRRRRPGGSAGAPRQAPFAEPVTVSTVTMLHEQGPRQSCPLPLR